MSCMSSTHRAPAPRMSRRGAGRVPVLEHRQIESTIADRRTDAIRRQLQPSHDVVRALEAGRGGVDNRRHRVHEAVDPRPPVQRRQHDRLIAQGQQAIPGCIHLARGSDREERRVEVVAKRKQLVSHPLLLAGVAWKRMHRRDDDEPRLRRTGLRHSRARSWLPRCPPTLRAARLCRGALPECG